MLAKKTGSTDNLTGHLGTAKSTDCLIKEVAVFYIVSQIDCQNGQYMVKVAILNIPSLKINEYRSLRAVDRIILKLITPPSPHPPTSTSQTEICLSKIFGGVFDPLHLFYNFNSQFKKAGFRNG